MSGKRKGLHAYRRHSVGREVAVAPDVLAQYVGMYEVRSTQSPTALVNVTLENGALFLDRTPWIPGKDRQSLIPMSVATFAGHFGRRMRFERDDRGAVTRLVFEAPEPSLPDLTAVRRPVPTRKSIWSPINDLNAARAVGSSCPSADLDVGAHVVLARVKRRRPLSV